MSEKLNLIPEQTATGQETKERQPLRRRRILITGGATGTGLATACEVHHLGAEVIIGTRSQDHFSEASQQLRGERVYPFIADLTNDLEVQQATQSLDKAPTDIVHSAAAGMEPFLRRLLKKVTRLKKERNQAELQNELASLRTAVSQWVAEAQEFAMDVNYNGPVKFIQIMRNLLSDQSKLIVYTSFWSSLFGQVEVPEFYKGVAESKNKFEVWISEQALELVSQGIHPAIISGHLILDSNVGSVYKRFLRPLFPEKERPPLASFPTMTDMVDATLGILKSDPEKWPQYPLRKYVCGPGDVRSHLSPEDKIFSHPLL